MRNCATAAAALLLALSPCHAEFNATHWSTLAYVRHMLDDSACLWASSASSEPPPCSFRASMTGIAHHHHARQATTGIFDADPKPSLKQDCEYCSHGAHMIPWLMRRYKVHSLAEVGVCTGMSVVNVVQRVTSRVGLRHQARKSGGGSAGGLANDEALIKYLSLIHI